MDEVDISMVKKVRMKKVFRKIGPHGQDPSLNPVNQIE